MSSDTEQTMSTQASQDTCAIIAAGGLGLRFGDPRGKQYVELCGYPLIAWTTSAFDKAPSVGHIVVVCPAGRLEETRQDVETLGPTTPISYVEGGQTRQDSCWAGLEAVPAGFTYVAIHDAARPLVRVESIEHIIDALRRDPSLDGAIYAHPATDTLKVVEEGLVQATPERKRYWAVQTPQIFPLTAVRAAHEAAHAEGFVGTDDSSLVERNGGHVLCVESPADNFKVTLPEDRIPVEAILKSRALESANKAGGATC